MKSSDLLKLFKDICKENGLETTDYSGRYMYGSRCYGVVVGSEYEYKEMITDYNEGNLTSKEIKDLLNYKIDNMGNDKIIYYPNLVYDDKEYEAIKL